MGKKVTKADEKDTLMKWLLAFEEHIDAPCVVSLLIEDGKVLFRSCIAHKTWEEADGGDEESPAVDITKLNARNFQASSLMEKQNYIG